MSERDDYSAKIETLLDNWNSEFDQLEDRIGTTDADPKGDYDEVIMELREKRNQARTNQ